MICVSLLYYALSTIILIGILKKKKNWIYFSDSNKYQNDYLPWVINYKRKG